MDNHTNPPFIPSEWIEGDNKQKQGKYIFLDSKEVHSLRHDQTMQTLLQKHCGGDGHHPNLISFIGACNSIGIPENECREFLHQNQSCISPESSYHNNPKQLDKAIGDIYKRYAKDFGAYKQEKPQIASFFKPELEAVEREDDLPRIPKEVYENLPMLLQDGCNILTDEIEREVFLIGALGFLSGCLPNVWMYYDGQKIESNLFVYITTRAGGGKGSLVFAYLLVKAIHDKKKKQYEEAQKAYKQELKQYRKDLKNDPDLEEPRQPKIKMLVIPANNSSTGVVELINENDGRVILFETEGDTLAITFKTDYGNYSDCLRKAFHHETIRYYRRGGKEYVEIENPYLSAIFSSTFDQLKRLIPTAENGLFSRFLLYEVKPSMKFKKVKDRQKNGYEESFLKLGEKITELYEMLVIGKPIEILTTEEQNEKFYKIFQKWKYEVNEFISEDLDGTVNRLGIISNRIMMIFTTLRILESGESTNEYVCTDQDFDNAMRIVEILKKHAILIYRKLPSFSEDKYLNSELKKRVYDLLPEKFRRQDVLPQVLETGIITKTFDRFLKTDLFTRLDHGYYQKNY